VTQNALSQLREQLSGDVPEGVRRLGDAELRDLAQAISDARHREGQALAASGERALERVPRLLRGPIRKVVG
jgi:uncharacterized protein YdbL (DUF1318 family)